MIISEEWKKYCKNFWQDDFRWDVVKAKTYSKKEIRKYCHALKIARDTFSNNHNPDERKKYLKFCSLKNELSFEYTSKMHEIYITCTAFNEDLISIQQGKNNSGEIRKKIIENFNKGKNYQELVSKFGQRRVDDFGANCRNFFNWWDDWGYGFKSKSSNKGIFFITEIGNDSADKFDSDSHCLAIFRDQLKKYQFPNFSENQLSLEIADKEAIKPYYGIVQILYKVPNNFVTKDEFILFVSKTKNNEENSINNTVKLIKNYRKLSEHKKESLNNYLNFKDKNKRANGQGQSYALTREVAEKSLQAFSLISGDLFESLDNKIFINNRKIKTAEKIINEFNSDPIKQYHEFKNTYEYNFSIGSRKYVNINEILKRNYFSIEDNSETISKKILTKYKGFKPERFDRDKKILLEIQLQKYYEKNVNILHDGDLELEIQTRPGKHNRETLEYNTFEVGEIDLLCKDLISGYYYVIEIKRDEADGKALGQLLQYMGWVQRAFGKETRGILVSKKSSNKFNYAKDYIDKNLGELSQITLKFHDFTPEEPPQL